MPIRVRSPHGLLLALILVVGVLACSETPQGSTVVVVVRHADKDTIPKDDPPLTADGIVRSQALASALEHAGVQVVITTQLVRSQQTGRPFEGKSGLTMVTIPRGKNIAQHAALIAAEVRRHLGKTVLVIGHGETVGPIIVALGGPRIAEVCAGEYSNLYTLVLDSGSSRARVIQSAYGAPSAPHTAPCS
jgi:broad specificity phosphatase PhoE